MREQAAKDGLEWRGHVRSLAGGLSTGLDETATFATIRAPAQRTAALHKDVFKMTIITSNESMARRAMKSTAIACCLIAMSLALVGCGSSGSSAKSGSMSSAMSSYNRQDYAAAQDQASAVMAKTNGPERERAAYLAGLSAYQAGDMDAAERDLTTASSSSTPEIAGDAKAMLGQICLDQHRARQAAAYFADASRLLEGENARQAAWHAGLAYRQAGDEANAKRWLDTASGSQFDTPHNSTTVASADSNVVSAAKPNSTTQKPPAASTPLAAANAGKTTVGFTLQVGAFNDKKRAKQAAEDAEALSRRESLGRVKVIPTKDSRGQTMYLVHVGWWVTRSEATTARNKIGKLEYIVAPAPAT